MQFPLAILVVMMVVTTSPLSTSEHVSSPTTTTVTRTPFCLREPVRRINCYANEANFPNGTEEFCRAQGCCWHPLEANGMPCVFDATHENIPRESTCNQVLPASRIACRNPRFFQQPKDADTCHLMGCCFDATTAECFQPLVQGYKLLTLSETPTGWNGALRLAGTERGPFGNDVALLEFEVIRETRHRLRMRITDPTFPRFEVPDLPYKQTQKHPKKDQSKHNSAFDVTFSPDPFGIAVTRRDTGEMLFNSTPTVEKNASFGGLVFENQFLEISTQLNATTNDTLPTLYGLGERLSGLRLGGPHATGDHYPMFARDQERLERHRLEGGDNLYGVHPFHVQLLDSGHAHGLFMLSSNAMEVVTQRTALTYRLTGGILDMFLFAGPSPQQVVSQYSEVVGPSELPPYWALGYHFGTSGVKSINESMASVRHLRSAGVPVEAHWHDLDYLDNNQAFTLDHANFPPHAMRTFIEDLHFHNQYYVNLHLPAIQSGRRAPAAAPPGVSHGRRTDPVNLFAARAGHTRASSRQEHEHETVDHVVHSTGHQEPNEENDEANRVRHRFEQSATGAAADTDTHSKQGTSTKPPASIVPIGRERVGRQIRKEKAAQREKAKEADEREACKEEEEKEEHKEAEHERAEAKAKREEVKRARDEKEEQHREQQERERFARLSPFEKGHEMNVFIKGTNGEPLAEKMMYANWVSFIDFFHPNATLYWQNLLQTLHDQIPFDGVWIDMNEPSSSCDLSLVAPGDTCVPLHQRADRGSSNNTVVVAKSFIRPPDVAFPFDPYRQPFAPGQNAPEKGSHGNLNSATLPMAALHYGSLHYNLHSLYGHQQIKSTRCALTKVIPRRSLVLSRSTFPGDGRYAGHWLDTGDASWEMLQLSIAGALRMNMFGIPLVGPNICGNGVGCTKELFIRWNQVSAYLPLMRNHAIADSMARSPLNFDDETTNIVRDLILRRYMLLPFLYTMFYQAKTEGIAVIRPLAFDYPADHHAREAESQFMLGTALMISPVVHQGSIALHAYFPRGDWYDVDTGRQIKGPGFKKLLTPLRKIQSHIRGGAIIAMQKPEMTTTWSRKNPYTLLVALGDLPHQRDGRMGACGMLFLDDGDSLASVEDKRFSTIGFSAYHNASNELTVGHQILFDGYQGPETKLDIDEIRVLGLRKGFAPNSSIEAVLMRSGHDNRTIKADFFAPANVLVLSRLHVPILETFDVLVRALPGTTQGHAQHRDNNAVANGHEENGGAKSKATTKKSPITHTILGTAGLIVVAVIVLAALLLWAARRRTNGYNPIT